MQDVSKFSPAKLRQIATEAIIREIGVAGYIRYIQDLTPGEGDYTRDRWKFLPQGQSVEKWVEEIRETEKALGLEESDEGKGRR